MPEFVARGVVLEDMNVHVLVWLAYTRVRGTTGAVLGVVNDGTCWGTESVEAHRSWRSIRIVDVGCWETIPSCAGISVGVSVVVRA